MDIEQEKIQRKVIFYASQAHKGQTRKFGADKGKPYFDTHISRVANAVINTNGTFDQVMAAWLHDLKEDQYEWWAEEVLLAMGISRDALDIVDSVTKREGENYLQFTLRVIKNPEAILVKTMDITDNMSDLKEGSMKDKYRLARYLLDSESASRNWVSWSQKNGND